MNIKSLSNLIVNNTPAPVSVGTIKSDSTHDRDANAFSFYQKQKNKKKEKMTAEQFALAVKKLNEKEFMKEMGWVAYPATNDEGQQFVEVKSSLNEVIKTILEFDMWELLTEDESLPQNKGQLLRTVA